jgi:hypothetical protein
VHLPIVIHNGKYLWYNDVVFVSRVLIEGVKYYASEPRMLGRTFLRLVSKYELEILLSDMDVSGFVPVASFKAMKCIY